MLNGIVPVLPARTTGCVGRLAQYVCDGAREEAGLGCKLVQPASLSLRHPVICLWIRRTVLLQLGQKGTLYAD